MLGTTISDPEGIEGPAGTTQGLGLLDVQTVMGGDKTLSRVHAHSAVNGCEFSGYEIHIGRTEGPDCLRPFATIRERLDGAVSADGKVMGSYLHGMFAADGFRGSWITAAGGAGSDLSYNTKVSKTLDSLAAHLEENLDLKALFDLALAR